MRRRRLPNVLDRDQLLKLFDAIDDPAVMMACLLATFCGLRKGEVAQLRLENVNLTTMKAKIVDAKNPRRGEEGYGKDRYVAIPLILKEALEVWQELIGNSTYFFPTIAKPDYHLHRNYIFRRYKEALNRAGLLQYDYTIRNGNKRCRYNFHTLRHSYATLLLEHTGNLDLVRKALGHSSISTTLIYTHLSDRHLQEKVNESFGAVVGGSRSAGRTPSRNRHGLAEGIGNDPYEVARLRLAAGQLTVQEFRGIVSALRDERKRAEGGVV